MILNNKEKKNIKRQKHFKFLKSQITHEKEKEKK